MFLSVEPRFGNDIIGDDFAPEKVLLNHTLKNVRSTMPVPDAFGIHDGYRTLPQANSQAIGFRPLNTPAIREPEFLESFLEKLPRDQGFVSFAALGFRLVAAEKNMSAGLRDPQ